MAKPSKQDGKRPAAGGRDAVVRISSILSVECTQLDDYLVRLCDDVYARMDEDGLKRFRAQTSS